MYAGHIRSTILGDTLARVLRMLGHRVVTQSHRRLGDAVWYVVARLEDRTG